MPLQLDHGPLRVRGRADGFDETDCHLDEVKTHRGAVEHIPLNHRALHWAQAKVYGWMACKQLAVHAIRISVVYFDVDTETETAFTETFEAASLRACFEDMADRYLLWAALEGAHRRRRETIGCAG